MVKKLGFLDRIISDVLKPLAKKLPNFLLGMTGKDDISLQTAP